MGATVGTTSTADSRAFRDFVRGRQTENNNRPRCIICRMDFSTREDLTRHNKGNPHNVQFMKNEFSKFRDAYARDKNGVSVVADPQRMELDCVSDPLSGRLLVSLAPNAKNKIKLHSCDTFISVPDVTIRHEALENHKALVLSPGKSVAIDIIYTPTAPMEIVVPIGLKFSTVDMPSGGVFHIIRELEFKFSLADLTPEETMGDHGDLDMNFYRGKFEPSTKVYEAPRVRTNNTPDLPMPIFKDPHVIPENLVILQRHMDALRYNDSFQSLDDLTAKCFQEIRVLVNTEVTVDNYMIRFDLMLYLEELAKRAQLSAQNLSGIPITRGYGAGRYQVFLPGLPEKRPNISIGFRIHVRESVTSTTVFQGIIVDIQDCTCSFQMHNLFDHKYSREKKYSLEFEFNRRTFQMMHTALKGCQKKVSAARDSCLFPKMHELQANPRVPLLTSYVLDHLKFFDPKVKKNPQQYDAVKSILQGCYRPAPFILFGPPGTGKTSTIAEAIKQIVTIQKSSKILVCASSNSACDVICDKLVPDMGSKVVFRIYSASFDLSKMSAVIKDNGCHNYINGTVDFPSENRLSEYRVIIATLTTSFRFSELPDDFFTHVFIDECGFSMEPESLIPIYGSVGDWKPVYESKPGRHLILAGDIQQLGPVLASSMCNQFLSISLMERLMTDRQGPYQKPFNKTYIVKLLRNYRSHHNILAIPNRLFYDDELLEHADKKVSYKFVNWPRLPNSEVPIVFHNCIAEEKRDAHSTSFFNIKEMEVVLGYVRAILQDFRDIYQDDIGVITPYAAQCRRVRSLFTRHQLYNIKVGSVEEFQGQERKVIIISTVRNCKDLLQRDLLQRLGFLKNPKRFNVALTRAKGLLICVGNSSILRRDKSWGEFIDYAELHRAWCGMPGETSALTYRLSSLQLGQRRR